MRESVYKRITSKHGVKMVVSRVTFSAKHDNKLTWCNVYTADEWAMGKGFRTPEFNECAEFEAISQAENY